jgi:glycosyltransferase involved in cell wall biosynthesis
VNGHLFDPDCDNELREKISALVDSPETRRRFGERARRDIEQKWNWNNIAKEMIEIFEDVLDRRRRSR